MSNNKTLDTYTNFLSSTNHEQWAMLHSQFLEHKELLTLKLETRDQAVGKKCEFPELNKKGRSEGWRHNSRTEQAFLEFDQMGEINEYGPIVKHHRMISYLNQSQYGNNLENLRVAKELALKLQVLFQERQLTLNFLCTWGIFCKLCGALEEIWLLGKPDVVNQLRSGQTNKIENTKLEQDVWFSQLYLALEVHPKELRSKVDEKIIRQINTLIENNETPPEEWLRKILDKSGAELSSRYLQTGFSRKKVVRMADEHPKPRYPLGLKTP